jgi:hypothetical protein
MTEIPENFFHFFGDWDIGNWNLFGAWDLVIGIWRSLNYQLCHT